MTKQDQTPVLVSLVTYNDEPFLARCLESVRNQTVPVRVKVFDNASEDRTREIADQFEVDLYHSPTNKGYSHGHNQNIHAEYFQAALLLNADVTLEPDWLEVLVATLDEVEGAGMAGFLAFAKARLLVVAIDCRKNSL